MEIRILTEHDAEAWWRLRRLALQTDPRSFVESVADHEKTSVEETREKFRRSGPENFIVGVFEDGRLDGMAGFYRDQHAHLKHKGTIWGVYVRQESRGKGAAKALIADIIRRARSIPGVEQILLVVSANLPARKLYESLGFASYGVEPRSLKISREKIGREKPGAEYVDDVLMILRLSDIRTPE